MWYRVCTAAAGEATGGTGENGSDVAAADYEVLAGYAAWAAATPLSTQHRLLLETGCGTGESPGVTPWHCFRSGNGHVPEPGRKEGGSLAGRVLRSGGLSDISFLQHHPQRSWGLYLEPPA